MEWLKEIRERAGRTQQEVAEDAEIDRSTYANIETGKRTPGVETAKKIAEALGFDWTRFYEKDEKGEALSGNK